MTLQLALWPILCGCVLLVDAPMDADEEFRADCKHPQTQMEINDCALQAFQAVDEALNLQYRVTRDLMRKKDADGGDKTGKAEASLIKSQRRWISVRDEQCQEDNFASGGGSIAVMEIANCKEEMTRIRIQELQNFSRDTGQ